MPRVIRATVDGIATEAMVQQLENELQQVTALVQQLRELVRKQGQEIDYLRSRVQAVELRR